MRNNLQAIYSSMTKRERKNNLFICSGYFQTCNKSKSGKKFVTLNKSINLFDNKGEFLTKIDHCWMDFDNLDTNLLSKLQNATKNQKMTYRVKINKYKATYGINYGLVIMDIM